MPQLVQGHYLQVLPTCSAAPIAHYTYRTWTQHKQQLYEVYCRGDNHKSAYRAFSGPSFNLPAYRSLTGLQDHPEPRAH